MLLRSMYWGMSMLLLCVACHSRQTNETDRVVTVKTEKVKNYQKELSIAYPGIVKAASDVNLAFRVAGPIASMPAEVGAFVRKGQLLAQIDPRDYEIQLSATEAEYKKIKGEAERIMELYKRGSIPVNDYEKAVYGLQQITAKYESHRNALKDTRLLAPFAGYVQKKYFDAHETVSAGMPVVSVISNDCFEVEIDIPSRDYIRQGYFKSFSCTFDIFPGKVFPLELLEVGQKANLNQLYRMRLRLRSENGVKIAAGMSVNVTIDYAPEENTMTLVPLTAVFEQQGQAYVWVYDSVAATVCRRPVTVGNLLKTGDMIIYEGLKADEEVVSAGVHGLREGLKVKLLKPISNTNVGELL